MRIICTAKYIELLKNRKPKNFSIFDKDQLDKGTKIEEEHTKDLDVSEKDKKKIAKEIASDHLEESNDYKGKNGGKYYDKLKKMERDIRKEIGEK